MEMWIRAIQAACNLEACKSDDPVYSGYQPAGQYYPDFIWNWWIYTNHTN